MSLLNSKVAPKEEEEECNIAIGEYLFHDVFRKRIQLT